MTNSELITLGIVTFGVALNAKCNKLMVSIHMNTFGLEHLVYYIRRYYI